MRVQKKPVVIDFLPFYNNILEVQNWVYTTECKDCRNKKNK